MQFSGAGMRNAFYVRPATFASMEAGGSFWGQDLLACLVLKERCSVLVKFLGRALSGEDPIVLRG